MPIYDYLCERCEQEFSREQRITDDPVKTCPHCRSRKVKRLISRTSFVLKGGGWYSDLYASQGAKADGEASGDGGKSAEEKSGKSDADKSAASADGGKSEKKDASKGDKSGGGDKGGSKGAKPKSKGKGAKSAA